jgi:MoaA/NifB/PqqE/SkfB family radical SAM enzyme
MISQFTTTRHEVGKLSKCGVLDVGLKCPHSCEFCYYSFLDGTDDQFKGMREAPTRPLEECKRALDFFAEQGLERLDITGGEPLFHPDIVEIVRYAEKEKNLRVRMITLAQLFDRKDKWTGKRMMDALLEDAGISEFLLSTHAVDPDLYREITKGNFARLERTMDELDERSFQYCTNTVVYAKNAQHIPEIAKYLVDKRRHVHISNFIAMNAYYAWSTGKAFGVQAAYRDLAGPLRRATHTLEEADIGVNIRYMPYCMIKGLERNIVGIRGVRFDPYEWRTGVRNPFLVLVRTEDEAEKEGVRELADNGKVFPAKCKSCSLQPICDGVDVNYLASYGEDELEPYAGHVIRSVVHFRHDNPRVFQLKQKLDPQGNPASAANLGGAREGFGQALASLPGAVRKFYWNRLHQKVFLSEIPMKGASNGSAEWADGTGPKRESGRLLRLATGSEVSFSLTAPGRAFLHLGLRLASDDGTQAAGTGRARVWVENEGEGPVGGADASVRITSRWKPLRLALRNEGFTRIRVRISWPDHAAPESTRLLCFEPVVAGREPFRYIARLTFKQLRLLGVRGCWRRLLAYAKLSEQNIRVDWARDHVG